MNSCGMCRLHITEAVQIDKASSRVCVHVTRVLGACAGSCDNTSAFEHAACARFCTRRCAHAESAALSDSLSHRHVPTTATLHGLKR